MNLSKVSLVLKALVALAGTIGVAVATIAADPSTSAILPQTSIQWLAAVGTMLITAGAVFGVRNARTVEQAQHDLDTALGRGGEHRRMDA